MHRNIARFLLVIGVLVLSLPAAPAALAGDPPCTTRPDNMTRNGSVTDGGYSTQYGTVANYWNPFVLNNLPPAFTLADNESANGDVPGSSSQYIHGEGVQFDGGIYQTISGTQPGAYYQFSVGWAAMLRDTGGGQNKKIDGVIGRMVGVDPTGGTDAAGQGVIWGSDLWTGSSGQSLNSPTMKIVFAAQSDHVTVFIRAHDTSSAASDKVFLDVMCLLPRGDMPTATLVASATPTLAPTNTPRAVAQSAPVVVPAATRAPTNTPKPTNTPTDIPTNTPTVTRTPTITPVPTDTPKPRRAIPLSGAAIDPGSMDTSSSSSPEADPSNSTGMVVLLGSVGLIGASGIGILVLGAFLVFRLMRRSNPRQIRYY